MYRAILIGLTCLYFVLLGIFLQGEAYAKDSRTYYNQEKLSHAKRTIERYQWAKDRVAIIKSSCAWILELSDEELWNFIPPPEQLRSINVCAGIGCPFCGKEIFNKGGHYPWIISRGRSFKVKCPSCNREFPDNDFVPWNIEGREGNPEDGLEITDKGVGWKDKDGHRYYFVAYYIFWQRWVKDILGGMASLSQAYLLSGEPSYAHKCAIMMSKIATLYQRFDYPTQGVHYGGFGMKGRISDRVWSNGDSSKIALAYDAIYPVFSKDKELLRFLRKKGISNPRVFIETRMLNVMAKDIMRGFIRGNMGLHQKTLSELAIVLDNDDSRTGPTTKEMREWLIWGQGRIEDLLWNGFWRDGMGGESSPHYSIVWGDRFYQLTELLPKLGFNIWDNPKWKKIADIGLDITVAGKFCPSIGDSGSLQGTDAVKRIWHSNILGRAFSRYKDPRYAKMLKLKMLDKGKHGGLFESSYDEKEVATLVEKTGTGLDLNTRSIGGYGLAILESGKDGNKRGVSMYYGDASGGHGHYDRLNIEMFAYGIPVLPEDGYPTPMVRPNFHQWRRANTYRHYSVMVDEKPHENLFAGHLNTLTTSPDVQLMDASAEIAYPDTTSLYRRTSALIDISEEKSYLLDIFRVRGGGQHDWCFHGPPFPEFSVSGGEFGPVQGRGTLAGENVSYGANPYADTRAGGSEISFNLQNSSDVLISEGGYWKPAKRGWALYGNGVITRKEGSPIRLKNAQIPGGKVNVLERAYDYNSGYNEIDVNIAGVSKTFRFDASGREGYRWENVIYDLSKRSDMVTVSARSIGQPCAIIDRIVLSKDLRLKESKVRSVSSGFQGLFNVRRMSPKGSWSATWRRPDDGLELTMTMPIGCTQEVIAAEGEPEAGYDNPKTIQYLLARNLLQEKKSSEVEAPLLSKYVAIVEPHRGPASVTSVEQLHGVNVSAEAVGLVVHRGPVKDLFHSSLLPEEKCKWEGAALPFTAIGEFAMLTVDGQGIKRACLVNGTLLKYGDFVLRSSSSPQGKVVGINHKLNTITIDKALSSPDAYRDMVVILGNEMHSTSYTIKKAKVRGGTTTLDFGDVLYLIRMGEVSSMDEAEGSIGSVAAIKVRRGRVEGDRHAGRWLYNEDKSMGFRIVDIRNNKFYLDGATEELGKMFIDTDSDGRSLYWISDIGPGDSFRIPVTTYYERLQRSGKSGKDSAELFSR